MPTAAFRFRAVTFDAPRYYKYFETVMKRQNQLAAGEWLRAVLTRVPVRTGMAQGSLLPLGRFLAIHHAGEMHDIIPIQSPDRINEGQLHAEDPESLFTSTGKGTFKFRFTILVKHFELNEFEEYGMGPYKNPADPTIQPPWNSMQAGAAAYNDYVQREVPKSVPKVTKFIYSTAINSGAGV